MNILIASKQYKHAGHILTILSYYFDARLVDTEWELKRELQDRNYDIVIFDYDLPQISGIRFVEELAKERLLPSMFYVCGPEAISSYDSRLLQLESGSKRVIPLETIAKAYFEIYEIFIEKSA